MKSNKANSLGQPKASLCSVLSAGDLRRYLMKSIYKFIIIFHKSSFIYNLYYLGQSPASLKHLFTFIFHEGVDPTNNFSERGIRPAVQWRKICFGNRSDNGAVLTSRLLTATRTCWLQKRNALEFLVSTINAYRKSLPAPSLLE